MSGLRILAPQLNGVGKGCPSVAPLWGAKGKGGEGLGFGHRHKEEKARLGKSRGCRLVRTRFISSRRRAAEEPTPRLGWQHR